jgi:hypothetical protein
MVTDVPPAVGPDVGEIEVTVGAATKVKPFAAVALPGLVPKPWPPEPKQFI